MSPNPIDCCTYKSGSWRSPRATVSPLDHPRLQFRRSRFNIALTFSQGITQRERLKITFIVDVWQTQKVCASVCVRARYSFSLYLIKSGSQGLANIVFAGMLIPASHALGSNQGCAVRNRPLWTRSEEIKRQSILVIGK